MDNKAVFHYSAEALEGASEAGALGQILTQKSDSTRTINYAENRAGVYLNHPQFNTHYYPSGPFQATPNLYSDTFPVCKLPLFDATQRVRRVQLLREIAERLAESEGRFIPQTQMLTGFPGVGKTLLALQYAHEQKEKEACDVVYWFYAEENLEPQFQVLASNLKVSRDDERGKPLPIESIVRQIYHLLSSHAWVLVFDNLEEEKVLKAYLPETYGIRRCEKQYILITTRKRWRCYQGNQMDVGVFLPEEAKTFIQQMLPTTQDEVALGLAKDLGYLPLAISQAVAYVQNAFSMNDLADYWQLFQDMPKVLLTPFEDAMHDDSDSSTQSYENEEFMLCLDGEYPTSLFNVVTLTLRQLNQSSLQAALMLAYVSPEAIPYSLIAAYLKEITGFDQPGQIDTVLDIWKRYALTREETKSSLSVHRLVQVCLRIHLEHPPKWLEEKLEPKLTIKKQPWSTPLSALIQQDLIQALHALLFSEYENLKTHIEAFMKVLEKSSVVQRSPLFWGIALQWVCNNASTFLPAEQFCPPIFKLLIYGHWQCNYQRFQQDRFNIERASEDMALDMSLLFSHAQTAGYVSLDPEWNFFDALKGVLNAYHPWRYHARLEEWQSIYSNPFADNKEQAGMLRVGALSCHRKNTESLLRGLDLLALAVMILPKNAKTLPETVWVVYLTKSGLDCESNVPYSPYRPTLIFDKNSECFYPILPRLNDLALTLLKPKGRWLEEAAFWDDLPSADYLLGQGICSIEYPEGVNALMWSAIHGQLSMVTYLLEQGVDVNQQYNSSGWWSGFVLVDAADRGHLELVKCLVEKGANVNQADKKGRTALMEAVIRDDLDMVKYLVDQGAEVNQEAQGWFSSFNTNKKGRTALLEAASLGYLEIVKCLVEKGANVNQADEKGSTALLKAVFRGDLGMVKYLVGQGAAVNQVDEEGNGALLWAVFEACERRHYYSERDFDIIRYLVEEQGTNIDQKNNLGVTAVIVAAANGYLEIVKYLVGQGADLNQADEKGRTALLWVFKEPRTYEKRHWTKRYLGIVRYLVEDQEVDVNQKNNSGVTALMLAARWRSLKTVKYLVGQGANVNQADKEGRTALMNASIRDLDMVKYLVDQDADLNQTDKEGNTVLLWAIRFWYREEKKRSDVICYLVEDQGMDVNQKNNSGATTLILAAIWGGCLEAVEYLMGQGANVNQADEEGRTPLLEAVRRGHLDMVKYLVGQGAAMNQADEEGNTALLRGILGACERCHYDKNFDVVRYLVEEHGADIDQANNRGFTAVIVAAANGYLEIVKYLVGQGADLNQVDGFGNTAFVYTAYLGHKQVAIYLQKRGAIMTCPSAFRYALKTKDWTKLSYYASDLLFPCDSPHLQRQNFFRRESTTSWRSKEDQLLLKQAQGVRRKSLTRSFSW